jgi:hypothetical protein
MSASVLSKQHIDMIVQVGVDGPSDTSSPWRELRWRRSDDGVEPVEWAELPGAEPDYVGAILMGANVDSVLERYQDSDASDMLPDWVMHGYSFTARRQRLSAVEALKAINCLIHQSNEHPDYEDSEAFRFCAVLRDRLILHLPGYDEARWEWDDPEPVEGEQETISFNYKGVERMVKPVGRRESRDGNLLLIAVEIEKDGVTNQPAAMKSYFVSRICGLHGELPFGLDIDY